jgi:hypothetical protein
VRASVKLPSDRLTKAMLERVTASPPRSSTARLKGRESKLGHGVALATK